MKRCILILLCGMALSACGGSAGSGYTPEYYAEYRRQVDACIVEHGVQYGVGTGVKDYCEALARVRLDPTLTPTPKSE